MITISIVEEMYYDNISVQNMNFKKNTKYKKHMVALSETEKYLSEHLKGKFADAFLTFGETWNFINNETNKESFYYGFRLGALIMHDVLTEKITD